MRDVIFPLLIMAVAIGVAIASIAWTRRRADAMLAGWAATNGYQLLQVEPRYLRTGPYFWRRSRSQMIYYVTVSDPRGWPRSGYVRLGSWFWGMRRDQVDVTWDS
ncbi:hypothetical protein K2Z83_11800 [Oscillochloris sp. ZM17-4]|uniref:hypothetical protein n=1 Tax=Oscillochloris sp. ZM17-4 TaxID=2866714 RepID=UPI001C73C7E9|nr:hypothetical protein [Oscillochloris sp. ZM17-4]MBX0328360.1 hypothetical protein [Oscillochloris sp. ZM17-4]